MDQRLDAGAFVAVERNDREAIALARDGDELLTSDAGDLLPLALAAGIEIEIVPT